MSRFEVGHIGLQQFNGVHNSVLLRPILSSHIGKSLDGVGELLDADIKYTVDETIRIDAVRCGIRTGWVGEAT
jgi:hypothetical protein